MHRHGSCIEQLLRARSPRVALPALLIMAGSSVANAQVPDVGPWRCVSNCGSSSSGGSSGSSGGRARAPSPGVSANDRGNALSRAGDYAAAEEAYREALRHRPNDAAIWFNLGRIIQLQGRLAEARDAYQRGAGRDRDALRMYLSLNTYLAIEDANSASAAGDFDAAERIIRAAMRVDPNATGQSVGWRARLAEIENARRSAYARAVIAAAIAAVDNNGDLDAAERDVRAALAADPSNTDLQWQLYRIAHQRGVNAGTLTEKLEYYRRAILVNPRGHHTYIALARLLSNNDRPQEAEAYVRQAIALAPDEPDYRTRLGIILAQTNRTAEAESAYREVLDRNPDHLAARTRLAELLSRGGAERNNEAYDAWREVVARAPADGTAQAALGAAAHRLGRRAEAEAAYRASIELLPPEQAFTSSYALARMLGAGAGSTAQDAAVAVDVLAQGAQTAGNSISDGDYFELWGLLLVMAGRSSEAREIFERGRARFPDDAQQFDAHIASLGQNAASSPAPVATTTGAPGGRNPSGAGNAQPGSTAPAGGQNVAGGSAVQPGSPSTAGGGGRTGITAGGTAIDQLSGAAGAGGRATGQGQANTGIAQEVFDLPGRRGSTTAPAVTVGVGQAERIPPALARNPRFVALESRRRELSEAREILETRLTQLREDRAAGRVERGASEVAEVDLKQRISGYTSQLQHVEVQRREMIRTADRSVNFDEAPAERRQQPARAPARTP